MRLCGCVCGCVGVRVCTCVDAGEEEGQSEICNALLNLGAYCFLCFMLSLIHI